jgi:hemoglobin-like flavoprotein
MLSGDQILLVKKTWRMLRGIDPSIVAGAFYARLFTSHPGIKKLFPKDMEPQYVKLIDMLSAVVSRLERLDELTKEIEAMAERHAGYGVKPDHYRIVGDALLWTLEKGLGNDWNPAVKAAWTEAYTVLADTMINASYGKGVV